MAFDNLSLDIITERLNRELEGAVFGKPFAVSKNDYAIPYTVQEEVGYRHGSLIFSMDPNHPLVSITKQRFEKVLSNTPFFNSLKKMTNSKVTSVKKLKGERVITISMEASKEELDEINDGFDFIFELFPSHPNCYLIAYPYGKIVSLYRSKVDIEKGVALTRNADYHYPDEREVLSPEMETIDEAKPYLTNACYKKLLQCVKDGHDEKEAIASLSRSKQLYVIGNDILPWHFYHEEAKEIDVSNIYSFYVANQKQQAKLDRNKELIMLIERSLKTAKKKESNLHKDLETANKNLIFERYGQIIYQYQAEINEGDTFIEAEGYKIPLNPKLNAPNNANYYFKKYRKAKSAISILSNLIDNTKYEIEYLEKKLEEAKDGTPRDIMELKTELLQTGYIKEKQTKKNKTKSNKPSKAKRYEPHYILLENGKIGFGMNGLQNETLTFDIASKEDLFLHIKDRPGAHVVILAGRENDEVVKTACELALYLSHQEEGEIYVTQRKNVKKNPEKIGLVNLLSYKVIYLREVRKSSKELFAKVLKTE